MRLAIFEDRDELGEAAARYFLQELYSCTRLVCGFPTGRTPLPFYAHVRAHLAGNRTQAEKIRAFLLDDYAGVAPQEPESFCSFFRREMLDAVDIPAGQVNCLDGSAADAAAECASYASALAAAGGFDLAILGLGRNGHLAFNEPGSLSDDPTRVVALAEDTRRDNAAAFGSPDRVPTHALTVGLAEILAARRILLLVAGAGKREALAVLRRGTPDPRWPATYLATHRHVTVLCDRDAL